MSIAASAVAAASRAIACTRWPPSQVAVGKAGVHKAPVGQQAPHHLRQQAAAEIVAVEGAEQDGGTIGIHRGVTGGRPAFFVGLPKGQAYRNR